MAARKTRLRIDREDLKINALVRTKKIPERDIDDDPEIVRIDAETGQEVNKVVYDKASGEQLEEGYGYRYVNEDGQEVPKGDIEYYQILDEDHREKVEKFEATLGSERTVEPDKWINESEVDEFLVSKVYEMWGEEDEDTEQLYELMNYADETGKVPVIPVVFRKSFHKKWGMLTPYHDGDEFGILMQITTKKLTPEHEMETITPQEMKEEQNSKTVEQNDPFGE